MPRPTASTRSNLAASTGDGAAFGAMVGLGETYFAAFALAIGLGEVAAGLIASLPMLSGGLLQLVSLRAVRWLGSEKRWVLLCATIQGLAFLPLAYAAWLGSISLLTMLIIASVYWAAGLATGPAWNTWMQSIVPPRIRAKYFARRTRASQLLTLVAFLGGGIFLQWSRGADIELMAFAILFAIAAGCRLLSVYFLSCHHSLLDPGASIDKQQQRQVRESIQGSGKPAAIALLPKTGRRMLVYLVVMQGMVQISGPYFAPYMLKEMQYSYAEFAAMIGVAFGAKIVAFSFWARIASSRGAAWLLWLGGLGITPIAGLWLVSQHFAWLAFVQLVSGTMWAAYELGFFLLFFETLPLRKRTRMLTIYNLGNTSAWCVGSLVGAGLLASMGPSQGAYLTLFALSSVGRALAVVLLIRALPPKLQLPVPVKAIGIRVLGLRLGSGGVDVPILPSIPPKPTSAKLPSQHQPG